MPDGQLPLTSLQNALSLQPMQQPGQMDLPPPDLVPQQMPQAAPAAPASQQPDLGSGSSQVPKQGSVPALVGFVQQMFGNRASYGYQPSTGGGPGNWGAQPGRPVSRLDTFEQFLGNLLSSFSTGLSNAGTGPAANARGFGAAVQAPYQRELQQYGLEQQQQQVQAQTGLQQAQAQEAQARASQTPITINGTTTYLPAEMAKSILQAQITGQSRIEAAQAQKRFMTTPFGVYDTQEKKYVGGSGSGGMAAAVTVNADMAKQYGLPDELVGKQVKLSDLISAERGAAQNITAVQGSEGASLVSKTEAANTGGKKGITKLGLGSPAANPIAQAKFGLQQAQFERDTFGKLFGDIAKKYPELTSIIDDKGNTIGWKGPSAPTASIKTKAQTAKGVLKVMDEAQLQMDAANKAGLLGPSAGRFNEWYTGAVGGNDPQFAALRTIVSMTNSGTLNAHFGARGASQVLDSFKSLLNSGKMTYADMNASLGELRKVMTTYANEVQTNKDAGSGGGANITFTPVK